MNIGFEKCRRLGYFGGLSLSVLAVVMMATTAMAQQTRYVVPPGTPGVVPTHPYTNWPTAATNFAFSVVGSGVADDTTIWVSNGYYTLSAQIQVGWAMRVALKGWSGDPADVIIDGSNATKCIYVWRDSIVDGLTITNGNSATGGGGVELANGWPNAKLLNSTIVGCTAPNGGGISVGNGTVSNCTIVGNTASGNGGGGYGVSNPSIYDSFISSNVANQVGGLRSFKAYGCTIASNYSATAVGGMSGSAYGCTIINNVAANPGSGTGGGGIDGNAYNSTISGNRCLGANQHVGGGVYCNGGQVISNCTISGNTSFEAGGVYLNASELYDCVISGNLANNFSVSTYQGGGGVQAHSSTIRNCLIVSNESGHYGGGVTMSSTAMGSCTIAGNTATNGYQRAGGIYLKSGAVTNCIIYHNIASATSINSNWFRGAGTFDYTCTTPSVAAYGTGNTTADPQFVDKAAGNYRLQDSSPASNTGTNQSWMTGALDLDGEPRIAENIVDMGAYEGPPPKEGTIVTVR